MVTSAHTRDAPDPCARDAPDPCARDATGD